VHRGSDQAVETARQARLRVLRWDNDAYHALQYER
jgi:hypothetical protein